MTKQQRKVYEYILTNPGCTTADISRNTFIQCPSGRISELRKQGIPVISIGHKKYGDTKPFEMYAIQADTLFPISPPPRKDVTPYSE
jgi:hypothetical protein